MDDLTILLSIAAVQFLGAASPGPTFIIVSSYSISESRSRGLLAAAGVLLATLTWALLAACGLGVLMAHFPAVHMVLQLASSIYLIWLGGKMLLSVVRNRYGAPLTGHTITTSRLRPFRDGFITNMTNPKSIAYYTSLFVVMLPSTASSWLFGAAVGTAFLVSAAWWISVALFFATGPVQRSYARTRRAIDAVFGSALVSAGVGSSPVFS
jgi:threonine efflux protein